MKNFKLIHETPDHFVLHNGISHFHVAKNGINEPTADKIRAMANGGKTVAGDITQQENKKNMAKIDSKIASKSYAEGGEAQSPEEAGVEAVERKNRTLQSAGISPTQSNEELEVEAEEKKRREQPQNYAEGGKLSTSDRAHISTKNFAGPDRSYPIEDASHARNALARVSQHGSPELKSQVRAKVHSKYPGIEQSAAQGESIPYRKPQKYDDGGTVDSSGEQSTLSQIGTAISNAFEKPKPTPTPTDHEANYAATREKNSQNMKTGNYAEGGSIANETQEQAIKRYADGNPATLSKGGHVHHNAGKNQLHFHFYDGAVVPTQLDKEEGAGPQQASPLDKYVGGESANETTPLDNYAGGGDVQPSDSDKLAQASQDVQQGLDSQVPQETSQPVDTQQVTPSQQTPTPTVPQSQQIPAVPKSLPSTPDQNPSLLSDFDKNLELEKSGIEQGAAAQTKGYQDTANAIGQNALQQKAQMDAYKIASDALTAQNTQLFNSVAGSKIDPDHFWNSKTTGGKIAATIGLLLGGIGGGLNGTNQNQALATLQNHVQQDIEAQKMDQSNKTNLYKLGLEKYRDAQSAQQFATLQSNALLQGQLQKIAAQTGAPQAQATAQQMIGQLGVQNAGLRSDLAMKQAAFGAMNNTQPQAGVDPNKMRLLINAGVIPKEEVPAAMKEYGDYSKLSNTLDHTDDVFKQAANTANYSERLANSLPLGSHIPTIRDSSKQYEALTNAWLGNITKDTEGRVTPTDVDLMRGSLPKAGDTPQLIQTKLNNIKDMIRQKYDFPTLQSYRLLHTNDPVAQPSATRQKRFTESAPK